MFLKLFFLSILSIFFISQCTGSNEQKQIALVKEESASRQSITASLKLNVSTSHINYFVNINKETYSYSELDAVFDTFLSKADPFCNMVWGRTRYDRNVIYEFIVKERFKEKLFSNMGHPIPKLISGCWNFYRMNDMDSIHDFQVVNYLFPNDPKDCYSVAFMQPYIMHNVLNCTTLNMLDVDWRILFGHYQMLNKLSSKEFLNIENFDDTIKDMNVGWVARFDGKPIEQRAKNIDISTFCYRTNYTMCKEMLLSAQNRFIRKVPISLHLSYLHEGKYSASKPNSMIVIYLSNAIDNVYTTYPQFREMLDSVSKRLTPEQSALFMYHAGGRDDFGIYQLKRKPDEEGYTIHVACRDKYKTPPIANKQGYYYTFFDYLTKDQSSAPSCKSVLYKMKKEMQPDPE